MGKRQNVVIKGTKDGLLLRLDDKCSYSELLEELEEKLSPHQNVAEDSHIVDVRINTGNRLLSKKQEKQIRELVHIKHHLRIEAIEADVVLKQEVERIKQETEMKVISRMIRSGQVLNITGDVLIIGDVNPGAVVQATGNIFVIGSLKGIAHAGYDGNEEAVICSSRLVPTQLRIAENYTRAPDRSFDEVTEPEGAYINLDKQIVIDRLTVLRNIRPKLNRFVEGGL